MKNQVNSPLLIAIAILMSVTNQTVSADQTAAAKSEKVLFGFDDPAAAKQWKIVNDGVMGGRSSSKLSSVDDGQVRFSGDLSLENNGGFASVRSKPASLKLNQGDVIVLRILGDGRKYMVNLYMPDRRMAFSYQAEFETTEGEWTEARLPLAKFAATSFGRRVEGNTLNPSQINSFGIMLADKKAGSFELLLDWIKVESAQ